MQTTRSKDVTPWWQRYDDINAVLVAGGIAIVSSLSLLALFAWKTNLQFGSLALWTISLVVSSGLVGFLFGIPKVLQSPRGQSASGSNGDTAAKAKVNASERSEYRSNTNLEEISDWLTKIITGLGLVNMGQTPKLIHRLVAHIAPVGGAEPIAHSIALALVLFALPFGFLFGYLLTRLYLQGALARADWAVQDQRTPADVLQESEKLRTSAVQSLDRASDATETAAIVAGEGGNAMEALRKLADNYLNVSIADYKARLNEKEAIAQQMYRFVVTQKISRDDLVKENNEGLIMALATTAHAQPEEGDLERLLEVAPRVSRLHVRYRITLAIADICRRGCMTEADRRRTYSVVSGFMVGADESLRELVSATLKVISPC